MQQELYTQGYTDGMLEGRRAAQFGLLAELYSDLVLEFETQPIDPDDEGVYFRLPAHMNQYARGVRLLLLADSHWDVVMPAVEAIRKQLYAGEGTKHKAFTYGELAALARTLP